MTLSPIMHCDRKQWLLVASLIALIAGFYYPSLQSNFLLDDYANLNRLEEVTSKGHAYFIFGGIAGPGGRPLSLATFSLQHSAWPGNPFAFKLVNLLIHLLCGLLIFTITRTLLRKLDFTDKDAYWISLIALGLWLIHPVQISTVLYVVQRMAQLSTLMILAGIGGYLYFRNQFQRSGDPVRLIYSGVVISVATVLGILAKENGILLPLYIIVIEFVFFNDPNRKKRIYKIWYCLFLLAPLILLAIYFGYIFDRIVDSYDKRPFTMYERLLTQAVILFDYLQSIFIPRPDVFSVYHDDYQPVRGLFKPVYVSAAVAGIFVLLITAIKFRGKTPLVSFAILWFLAGHSLESSFLGLELYFEHRNYLPSLGIFVLLGWVTVTGIRKARSGLIAGGLGGAYLTGILIVSTMVLQLWANPVLQAVRWAELKPASLRSQTNLADMYLVHEEYDKAEEVYEHIRNTHPDILFPFLNELIIKGCVKNMPMENGYWSALYKTASVAGPDNNASLSALDNIVININRGQCDNINPVNLARVMLILAANPEFVKMNWAIHELLANISIYMGDARSAISNINRSIELRAHPGNLYLRVRIMLMLEDYAAAEAALNEFRGYLDGNPGEKLAYASLTESLSDDIKAGLE